MAHLKYLEGGGKLGREMKEQGTVFFTEVLHA
jgi:hypothetical protein